MSTIRAPQWMNTEADSKSCTQSQTESEDMIHNMNQRRNMGPLDISEILQSKSVSNHRMYYIRRTDDYCKLWELAKKI